jgi:Ras-related protein Rab-7A
MLKTFDSIISWKQEFLNQCGPSDPNTFPFMVVGNKCDLENDRTVSIAKSNQWAREQDLPLIEASAKDNIRIEDIFMEIVKKALKREKVTAPVLNNNVTLTPVAPSKKEEKKCC